MDTQLLKLAEIEKINDQIRKLEKDKQVIYQKLSLYKKILEKQYSFLIGRKALCTNIDNEHLSECICTDVMALNDYINVKPLFSKNGKKYIVETYEWI